MGMKVLCAALGLAAGMVSACSNGGTGGGRENDEVVEPAPMAAELAEQLGCLSTTSAPRGGAGSWESESAVGCVIDEMWPARVHAGLSESERSAALRLLASRADPVLNASARCADGTANNPVVVAGETWIIVVSDGDGARVVMERLGGRVDPAVGAGPPVSYPPPLPCTGEHRLDR